ncbi:hypothetical protein B5I52_004684 [Salmonella enterica subsp. enterica serovar Berkeley]|nr:hypothetical protein [Salmonella enterica subsp. enterica serovar Berkeley]
MGVVLRLPSELTIASERKYNCVRTSGRGEEAGSETVEPMNKIRIQDRIK